MRSKEDFLFAKSRPLRGLWGFIPWEVRQVKLEFLGCPSTCPSSTASLLRWLGRELLGPMGNWLGPTHGLIAGMGSPALDIGICLR